MIKSVMVLSLMSLSLLFEFLQSCRCGRIVLIIIFASLRNCCGLEEKLLLVLGVVSLSGWWSHLGRTEMVAVCLLIKQVIAVQVKIRWETLYSPTTITITITITIIIRSSSIGCWDKSSWNWHRSSQLIAPCPRSFGSSLARLSVGAHAMCEEITC